MPMQRAATVGGPLTRRHLAAAIFVLFFLGFRPANVNILRLIKADTRFVEVLLYVKSILKLYKTSDAVKYFKSVRYRDGCRSAGWVATIEYSFFFWIAAFDFFRLLSFDLHRDLNNFLVTKLIVRFSHIYNKYYSKI